MTNYATCCRSCNGFKEARPLEEFAREINIEIEDLPVHGDPVVNNSKLPIQIRVLRKQIFDRMRQGALNFKGKSAQNKLEKTYRREFWSTELGQRLKAQQPLLPGHVRIMVPEIRTIAKTVSEYLLLVELAKSANTRDLIGTVLSADIDIEARVRSLAQRGKDPSLEKRLNQALRRFEKANRRNRSQMPQKNHI